MMNSLKGIFESKGITISLRNYGPQDFATGWDVKAIVDNPDIFHYFYLQYPLTGLFCLDDYYLYLLSIKFISLREIVPIILQNDHRDIILQLSGDAETAVSNVDARDVIKFINDRIQDIFDKDLTTYDIRFVTLDLIAKYNTGIKHETFEFLCRNYGYQMIDRFDQFEKKKKKYPDLLELIYPTGKLTEINLFRFEKTLAIWEHILNKKDSSLIVIVIKRVSALTEDIQKLSDAATIDNILQVEGTIREFYHFLQRIKSPIANEFANKAKAAADLLARSIIEKGHLFKYDIPVEEIINDWKNTKKWINRLLCLTHDFVQDKNAAVSCISRLSREPEAKHPLLDDLRTNFPTDDYFTMSHQHMLSFIANIGTATIAGIVSNQETLIDYLKLVASAISLIIEQLCAEGEQLDQDVNMLSAMIQLIANNLNNKDDVMHGICYGTSMYACALSEKLVRVLYIHLAKDDFYIPINKATLGDMLTVGNAYIVDIFGKDHVQNLSFFLQHVHPSDVGHNIRNSLAHWSNVSPEAMTPLFAAKMLWLFTDILNTVFWYCIMPVTERKDSNDKF